MAEAFQKVKDNLPEIIFIIWMGLLILLASPIILIVALFPLWGNPHFLAGGLAGLLFYWCFLA